MMTSHNRASTASASAAHDDSRPDAPFQFVYSERAEDPETDRARKRRARSHAVTRGLERKRKLRQQLGQNFLIFSPENIAGQSVTKARRSTMPSGPSDSLSGSAVGPLQILAAESPKLQELLRQCEFHKATSQQPAVNILDELVLRHFHAVLRNGLDDDALLSAIMLTFAFSATSNGIDRECLGYQNKALQSIRQRMGSPDAAASEPTLAAILLLAGLEARLGTAVKVQLHMGAIRQLLEICQARGVFLSEGIKRAIFWQDLNTSVMAGSRRVVDHTTFPEFRWQRDASKPTSFTLPPGFRAHAHLLGPEFVEVLKDISALQRIRDSALFGAERPTPMAQIDNQQASIQSRIVALPSRSPISACCHLAAYLCSSMLRCQLWRSSTVPSHLSLQLLRQLKQAGNNPAWDQSPQLLTWLLHIGGAFAPAGDVRREYLALVRESLHIGHDGPYSSWTELVHVLQQFIWSESAFSLQVEEFWRETQT